MTSDTGMTSEAGRTSEAGSEHFITLQWRRGGGGISRSA